MDIVFILISICFLYIRKIIYLNKKAKDFSIIRALYSDIRIAFNDYLMVFYFKRSKIDKTYSGINIQITAILGGYLYFIAVIIQLFNRNPRPLLNPLFSTNNRVFLALVVYKILLTCLAAGSILPNSYFSYCNGTSPVTVKMSR